MFSFSAAVEGSKERDEGSPTSGAWGGSVERCLSGGGEMKAKGKRLLGAATRQLAVWESVKSG